MRNTGKKLSK